MKMRTLYVPTNVSTNNEIWKGLSDVAAVKALIVTAIAGVLAFVLGLTLHIDQSNLILGVVVVAAISIGVQQKLDSNLSMLDYLRITLKFSKEQKRYHYIYRR